MSLPIVFIHKSNSDYLKVSLSQAKKSNPDSQIYLLGDSNNNCYPIIRHHNMKDYFESADAFSKNYKHLNSNPYDYELFCFQRWFVLKEFLVSNQIRRCFYIDSDVMLYANVSSEAEKLKEFDMTLSWPYLHDSPSPHCLFINNSDSLFEFCDFLDEIYRNNTLLKVMNDQFERCRGNGGACDMTAFREYSKRARFTIGNTALSEDYLFDHNINESDGFETNKEIKKIFWVGHVPFCKEVISGRQVRVNLLHFQGSAKRFMKEHGSDKLARSVYFISNAISKLVKIGIKSLFK